MPKIDLKAFQQNSDGTYRQALADELTSGETVGGAEKLTQQFWVLLMTPRGSVPYLASQGTNFMSQFLVGAFSSDHDVFVNFAAAMVAISPQLNNSQTSSDPLAEQFARGVLEKVYVSPDEVHVQVRVDNKDGSGEDVLIPLTTQVR